jgi:hypothetical protein
MTLLAMIYSGDGEWASLHDIVCPVNVNPESAFTRDDHATRVRAKCGGVAKAQWVQNGFL